MKIVQFCVPTPGELIALMDTGELWERTRDQQDFNSGPHHRPKFNWRRLELAPEFAGPTHGERVEARQRENRS